jgi:hypothetical protein
MQDQVAHFIHHEAGMKPNRHTYKDGLRGHPRENGPMRASGG